MRKSAEEYDFSDYPKDHRCYSTENKKVIGKFKDECNGRPITEFVRLRPKMYSILEFNGDNIRKTKGVQKPVVKKDLRHELYKHILYIQIYRDEAQTAVLRRQLSARRHDQQLFANERTNPLVR